MNKHITFWDINQTFLLIDFHWSKLVEVPPLPQWLQFTPICDLYFCPEPTPHILWNNHSNMSITLICHIPLKKKTYNSLINPLLFHPENLKRSLPVVTVYQTSVNILLRFICFQKNNSASYVNLIQILHSLFNIKLDMSIFK